jgi:hypothetical protein
MKDFGMKATPLKTACETNREKHNIELKKHGFCPQQWFQSEVYLNQSIII